MVPLFTQDKSKCVKFVWFKLQQSSSLTRHLVSGSVAGTHKDSQIANQDSTN
jgi:hypothetical protein